MKLYVKPYWDLLILAKNRDCEIATPDIYEQWRQLVITTDMSRIEH